MTRAAVELAGFVALLTGLGLVAVPLALVVGGLGLMAWANVEGSR